MASRIGSYRTRIPGFEENARWRTSTPQNVVTSKPGIVAMSFSSGASFSGALTDHAGPQQIVALKRRSRKKSQNIRRASSVLRTYDLMENHFVVGPNGAERSRGVAKKSAAREVTFIHSTFVQ